MILWILFSCQWANQPMARNETASRASCHCQMFCVKGMLISAKQANDATPVMANKRLRFEQRMHSSSEKTTSAVMSEAMNHEARPVAICHSMAPHSISSPRMSILGAMMSRVKTK